MCRHGLVPCIMMMLCSAILLRLGVSFAHPCVFSNLLNTNMQFSGHEHTTLGQPVLYHIILHTLHNNACSLMTQHHIILGSHRSRFAQHGNALHHMPRALPACSPQLIQWHMTKSVPSQFRLSAIAKLSSLIASLLCTLSTVVGM